jgi:hypothetical protein
LEVKDLEQLFYLIRERCDPYEVLELCNIGIGELTLRFRGRIIENRDKFEEFLDLYSWDLEELYDYDDKDEDDEEEEGYEDDVYR